MTKKSKRERARERKRASERERERERRRLARSALAHAHTHMSMQTEVGNRCSGLGREREGAGGIEREGRVEVRDWMHPDMYSSRTYSES